MTLVGPVSKSQLTREPVLSHLVLRIQLPKLMEAVVLVHLSRLPDPTQDDVGSVNRQDARTTKF